MPPTLDPSLRAIYYDPDKRVKRPASQFYWNEFSYDERLLRIPGDHQKTLKGAWLDTMTVLHQSSEYGIARYPLAELAAASHNKIEHLRELAERGILRGADSPDMDTIGQGISPACTHTYSRKHQERAGETEILLPEQPGPVWYCNRFVKDEFFRWMRGQHGKKSLRNPRVPAKRGEMDTISTTEGGSIGGSPSSSSSSSASPSQTSPPSKQGGEGVAKFPEFGCQTGGCKPSEEEAAALLDDLAAVLGDQDLDTWLKEQAAASFDLPMFQRPIAAEICMWILDRAHRPAKKSRRPDVIDRIYARYQELKPAWYKLIGKPPPLATKLTQSGRAAIRAHLGNGRTEADLLAALDQVKNSAWLMGKKTGEPRLSVSQIFARTGKADQIEILLEKTRPDRELDPYAGGGYGGFTH